jgi:hypothetical protein
MIPKFVFYLYSKLNRRLLSLNARILDQFTKQIFMLNPWRMAPSSRTLKAGLSLAFDLATNTTTPN